MIENYDTYQICIQQNLNVNPDEWTFKNNNKYNEILEHININESIEILKQIKKDFEETFNILFKYLILLAITNDKYGKPIKHNYNNFCECSPSNLRYIYHSLRILTHMRDINIKTINIIEIGGGYGGLCFYIKKLSKLFEINIESYHIFDLPEPAKLQELYLKQLDIDGITTSTINDNYNLKTNSYLISNYALSEFKEDIRIEYYNKIISKYVSNGFLIWNNPNAKFDYISDKIKYEHEKPYSCYYSNFIIYF